MPELPEVEACRRLAARHCTGKRILQAEVADDDSMHCASARSLRLIASQDLQLPPPAYRGDRRRRACRTTKNLARPHSEGGTSQRQADVGSV